MRIKPIGPTQSSAGASAIAAMAVGVLGQLGDGVAINEKAAAAVHALFGLSLCLAVARQFRHQVHRSANPDTPRDVALLVRSLSRQVYILLYALFGIRQVINYAIYLAPSQSMTADEVPLSHEVSHVYLYYGLIAVAGLRLLAFRHRHPAFQTSRLMVHRKVRYFLWRKACALGS